MLFKDGCLRVDERAVNLIFTYYPYSSNTTTSVTYVVVLHCISKQVQHYCLQFI